MVLREYDYYQENGASAIKRQDSTTGVGKLLAPALNEYPSMEVVLMPIILHKHYHLLVQGKERKECRHYSSLNGLVYN